MAGSGVAILAFLKPKKVITKLPIFNDPFLTDNEAWYLPNTNQEFIK